MNALIPIIVFVRRDTSFPCLSEFVFESSSIFISSPCSFSALRLGLDGDTSPTQQALAHSFNYSLLDQVINFSLGRTSATSFSRISRKNSCQSYLAPTTFQEINISGLQNIKRGSYGRRLYWCRMRDNPVIFYCIRYVWIISVFGRRQFTNPRKH